MDNFRRLSSGFSIQITADEDGFTGRECPNPECEGYFKIEFGTGLKGENQPCHCPYCGHTASHDNFWTKEQIEYAKSVSIRQITDAIFKDLKELEFNHKPKGSFGIGLSLEVTRGTPHPIHYYREKKLETDVVCGNCTLHYSVYGVFAFCPDCGQHNSVHILNMNLEVVKKMLLLSATSGKELTEKLVENALEDCVSSFDGFGREICRVNSQKATNPSKAENISFQNLEGGKQKVNELFNIDLSSSLTIDEWKVLCRGFQKRHLLSHKMGVIDEEYIRKSGDVQAVTGRKISISKEEVNDIVRIVNKLACYMDAEISK